MDPLHIFTPLAHMQFQPSALRLGWKEFKSKEEKEQKKNKDFALFMILWLCSLAQEPELTSEISSEMWETNENNSKTGLCHPTVLGRNT